MGGKSKKQTIGYKYYVGLHAVFCHGPIDLFSRITVDDRVAWQGSATDGQITVSAEKLFGGEEREGGVSGKVDIEMGELTQPKNSYLLSKIGANIPAYRGVAAMVFRDFYWGNNPYLKPARARGQRVYTAQDGALQWYPIRAGIPGAEASTVDKPFTLTWWQSSFHPSDADFARMGMRFYDDGGTLIDSDFSAMIGTPNGVWTERTLTGTQPAGTAYAHLVMEMDRDEGTNNDGYIDDISLEIGGINIPIVNPGAEENTVGWTSTVGGLATRGATGSTGPDAAHGGTYFFDGGAFAFTSAYQQIGVGGLDMNPAHIIRECLTNQDWGMGYDPADVDDDSFEAAADQLFAEGMGMSLLWDKQATIEDFINEVVRHVDAALYVSRSTGKFVLKLIRGDYDPEALPLFDESNVERVADPRWPASGELVNSVTVNFWNSRTGREDSVTVQDPAGVQMQGAVINQPMSYPGFTSNPIAARVAERDRHALSNPYLSCTVYAGEDARDLEPGDVFRLSWAKWGLVQVPMRITGVAIAEGPSEQVRLTVVEDVFGTPSQAVVVPDGDGWVDPSQPPDASTDELVFEAPYYEIVQTEGQTDTDTDLTVNPLLGYVMAAAARPAAAINAKLWTDDGSGFDEADVFDFCPSGLLEDALGKTQTTAVLTDASDLDLVTMGSHFQIDDELLRIDAIDLETGEIEFGRGVLDTVPTAHEAGARAYFWDLFAANDPTEYASGETVDVRVTPISGAGAAELADAENKVVTLDQRAYRPYPPGNLLIEGESYAEGAIYGGTINVEWVGRDRTQQTSGELADHFDGNIGPEAGVTYRMQTFVDDVLADDQDPVTSPATVDPPADGLVRIEVSSKRDGVYSMQAATHEFLYVSFGSLLAVEDGEEYHVTEDGGDYRGTED